MLPTSWKNMSVEELELQYQPSQWAVRVLPEDVVSIFVRRCSEQSDQARSTLTCKLDVRYGPGPEQVWHEFDNALPDPTAPLIAFIHGGYWQQMSAKGSCGPALAFSGQLGFRTLVLGYDLAPDVDMDGIVQQVRTAARQILQESFGRRLMFIGHSAGSHLIAMVLTDWAQLTENQHLRGVQLDVVHVSGVFDLEPLVNTTVNLALVLDIESARRLSPLHQVKQLLELPCSCRHLVLVGQHDSPEFIRQSRQYSDALKSHLTGPRHQRHEVHLRVMDNHDHFSICEALASVDSDVMQVIQSVFTDRR